MWHDSSQPFNASFFFFPVADLPRSAWCLSISFVFKCLVQLPPQPFKSSNWCLRSQAGRPWIFSHDDRLRFHYLFRFFRCALFSLFFVIFFYFLKLHLATIVDDLWLVIPFESIFGVLEHFARTFGRTIASFF